MQRIRYAQALLSVDTREYTRSIKEKETHAEKGGNSVLPRGIKPIESSEPIAVRTRLIDLLESDVHEVVTVDKTAVEYLAVLRFYELRPRLRWFILC